MSKSHRIAIFMSVIGAIGLIAAILFGQISLKSLIGVDRSLRETAISLWSFLLPAWFLLEDAWFSPPADDQIAVDRFRKAQQNARLTWLIVGGSVGIAVGLTAPSLAGH